MNARMDATNHALALLSRDLSASPSLSEVQVEAEALQAVNGEIADLLGCDVAPIREHVARSMLLAERLGAAFILKVTQTNNPNAQALLAGTALRALNTAGRLAAVLAASAPTPTGSLEYEE